MDTEHLERPTYFGILPASVRYDESISSSAKLLYVEITVLTNKTGTCWASNQYFADLYRVNKTTISDWVRQLEAAGHITTKVVSGGFRGISVVKDPSEKSEPPLRKKPKHNNTSNNKSYVDLEKSLLSLVNEVTGRNFRTLPERGVKKTLDAFSLEEINSALRALARDPWHRERLKEFKIDYLIRATTIDKFLGQASNSNTPARDENGVLILTQEEINERLRKEREEEERKNATE